MGSTGSVNSPSDGLLVCLMQYKVPWGPDMTTKAAVMKEVDKIITVDKSTKAGYPGMDLMVNPEYSTQGLNIGVWYQDEITDTIPGEISDKFAEACKDGGFWGVFSILERDSEHNEKKNAPFNSAIIINDKGNIALKYHKLMPWVPIEPWWPGDLGMVTCKGPKESVLAVNICHDGMFPELAREAAYKGTNVYVRISGYSTQVNDQWKWTNVSNAWQNLMYTLAVNLAGYDGVYYYFGEGQICNFDGVTIQQGDRNPMELVTGNVFPRLSDNARKEWALENNIFNLGSRGYVGKPGGEKGNYLTWVDDLAKGKYKLPWDDEIKIRDKWKYPGLGER